MVAKFTAAVTVLETRVVSPLAHWPYGCSFPGESWSSVKNLLKKILRKLAQKVQKLEKRKEGLQGSEQEGKQGSARF